MPPHAGPVSAAKKIVLHIPKTIEARARRAASPTLQSLGPGAMPGRPDDFSNASLILGLAGRPLLTIEMGSRGAALSENLNLKTLKGR